MIIIDNARYHCHCHERVLSAFVCFCSSQLVCTGYFPSFLQHRQRDGMETTCRLVYPSRGIEDEVVWSPHAASFPLLPAALKMRRCGVHTPPRFPSFLGHRRRGGVESTRCLVSPLPWGIKDEAAWSPHTDSFPLFPGASKTRRRGSHTPPRFPSSLWHRGRGGVEPTRHLVSSLHCGIEIEDKAA
jgi:hypothetical protein